MEGVAMEVDYKVHHYDPTESSAWLIWIYWIEFGTNYYHSQEEFLRRMRGKRFERSNAFATRPSTLLL